MVYYLRDYEKNIEIVIPPETALCNIREGTILYASEILTNEGKDLLQDYYTSNWK